MGWHLSTLERGCKYTRYTAVGLWLWILKKAREASLSTSLNANAQCMRDNCMDRNA